MKTFVLICTICLITMKPSSIYAQGELSLIMGIHPSSKVFPGSVGTHTALQYNVFTQTDFRYGLVLQDSRFADRAIGNAAHISSLNGFVSFPLVQNSRIKPYIKMEVGAAYANARPRPGLEVRSTPTLPSPTKFISGQVAPAIGTQIMISRIFSIQAEYKRALHLVHPLVTEGDYNFGTIDLGITYKISGSDRKKHTSATRSRCIYNRKTGATSCFRFK